MHATMTDQAQQKACIKLYKVPIGPLPSMHPDPQSVEWDQHLHEAFRMWAERTQPHVSFAGTFAGTFTANFALGFAGTFAGTNSRAARAHPSGHYHKQYALHLWKHLHGHCCAHIYNLPRHVQRASSGCQKGIKGCLETESSCK